MYLERVRAVGLDNINVLKFKHRMHVFAVRLQCVALTRHQFQCGGILDDRVHQHVHVFIVTSEPCHGVVVGDTYLVERRGERGRYIREQQHRHVMLPPDVPAFGQNDHVNSAVTAHSAIFWMAALTFRFVWSFRAWSHTP